MFICEKNLFRCLFVFFILLHFPPHSLYSVSFKDCVGVLSFVASREDYPLGLKTLILHSLLLFSLKAEYFVWICFERGGDLSKSCREHPEKWEESLSLKRGESDVLRWMVT